jgi:hypothetical protein
VLFFVAECYRCKLMKFFIGLSCQNVLRWINNIKPTIILLYIAWKPNLNNVLLNGINEQNHSYFTFFESMDLVIFNFYYDFLGLFICSPMPNVNSFVKIGVKIKINVAKPKIQNDSLLCEKFKKNRLRLEKPTI